MKDEKRVEFIFDVNKQLQQQIKDSKVINYAMSATILMGGLLALGVSLKVLSYTLASFNNLKNTIQNK
jgi:hypothetical protein